MPVIRSPGRVRSTHAPSARIFTRRATVLQSRRRVIRVSTATLRPAFSLPRAVHLARSRLHSRPYTSMLSRETRRDGRQYGGQVIDAFYGDFSSAAREYTGLVGL